MSKDLSRMHRAKIKRDKRMYDITGTYRWVPYKQWEQEVIRNPTGPTALRAKREKDPDLNKIEVDIIAIGVSGTKREDLDVPPMPEAKEVKRLDLTFRSIGESLARRFGFRTAEEGKGSAQKKRIKNEGERKDK